MKILLSKIVTEINNSSCSINKYWSCHLTCRALRSLWLSSCLCRCFLWGTANPSAALKYKENHEAWSQKNSPAVASWFRIQIQIDRKILLVRILCNALNQCSGSVTFWYGSGCGCPFRQRPSNFKDANKNKLFFFKFLCLFFLEGIFTLFFKDKK